MDTDYQRLRLKMWGQETINFPDWVEFSPVVPYPRTPVTLISIIYLPPFKYLLERTYPHDLTHAHLYSLNINGGQNLIDLSRIMTFDCSRKFINEIEKENLLKCCLTVLILKQWVNANAMCVCMARES